MPWTCMHCTAGHSCSAGAPFKLLQDAGCTCGMLDTCAQVKFSHRTGGVPGEEAPPEGAAPVQIYFANPDLLWANEFDTPRLGQGAFAACIQMLHKEARQYLFRLACKPEG